MYKSNQSLHFVGIGGVGMAGIAEVLLNLNYPVSGSDLRSNSLTEHLKSIGAEIIIGHSAENLPDNTTFVVLSSAISPDNPEVLEAKSRGIPAIPRAEMLAELMRMKYGVAVAGAHGKTTTTSMIGKVLSDVGLDPTIIIGGRVLTAQTGAKIGMGQYLVAEADESDGSFCLLRPAIAVVTNIDAEHMSHYGSFGALEESFFSFMSSVPFYGLVIVCGDDPVLVRLCSRLKRRVIRYGFSPELDITASDVESHGPNTKFKLRIGDSSPISVELPVVGMHMVSNALAAVAVALELGAEPTEIVRSLSSFPGVSRRTEIIAEHNGVLIIDDYAHHPSEISATLGAIRQSYLKFMQEKHSLNELGRLIVLFQPHRYSRTKDLFAKFLTCFNDADEVWIGDIYAAGEEPIEGISGENLAAAMLHPGAHFGANLQQVLPKVAKKLQMGDIVLTVGAGSVGRLAPDLARIVSDLPPSPPL